MTRLIAAACVLAALLTGGTVWVLRDHSPAPATTPAHPTASPTETIPTSFPDLAAPTGDPELEGLRTASPAPGTVAHLRGPFDDRFTLSRLSFTGPAVAGRIDVTSDVSDILDLQVLAGFYDGRGHYLGENRFTYHLDEGAPHEAEGPPSELMSWRIRVPDRFTGQARSAAVGVTVLVNE